MATNFDSPKASTQNTKKVNEKMVGIQIRRVVVMGLVLGLMVAVGGCASSGDASTSGKVTQTMSIPRSSPLATLEIGMSDIKVRKAIGEPDDARSYMTGKAWIPFYFGGDTHRSDWMYSGVGRVVFSRNRWSGALTVVDLRYNPGEP